MQSRSTNSLKLHQGNISKVPLQHNSKVKQQVRASCKENNAPSTPTRHHRGGKITALTPIVEVDENILKSPNPHAKGPDNGYILSKACRLPLGQFEKAVQTKTKESLSKPPSLRCKTKVEPSGSQSKSHTDEIVPSGLDNAVSGTSMYMAYSRAANSFRMSLSSFISTMEVVESLDGSTTIEKQEIEDCELNEAKSINSDSEFKNCGDLQIIETPVSNSVIPEPRSSIWRTNSSNLHPRGRESLPQSVHLQRTSSLGHESTMVVMSRACRNSRYTHNIAPNQPQPFDASLAKPVEFPKRRTLVQWFKDVAREQYEKELTPLEIRAEQITKRQENLLAASPSPGSRRPQRRHSSGLFQLTEAKIAKEQSIESTGRNSVRGRLSLIFQKSCQAISEVVASVADAPPLTQRQKAVIVFQSKPHWRKLQQELRSSPRSYTMVGVSQRMPFLVDKYFDEVCAMRS